MYKQKLGLGTMGNLGLTVEEQIRLFKKVGFEAFFTGWGSKDDPVEEWAKCAKECGMIYQSIHAPFGKVADMWGEDDVRGDRAVAELIECLDACARAGVPIMIVHAFIGFFDENVPTKVGIERYTRVVDAARERGVKIALENTEGEEYLEALLTHFKNDPTVGFCWDSGHEMCYNRSQDLLAKYGDQLIATHINDNLGIRDYNGKIIWRDDLHLLPFDGIGDWRYNGARLKKAGCPEVLTFELLNVSKPDRHENDNYAAMSAEQYITQCYIRACKVAAMIK